MCRLELRQLRRGGRGKKRVTALLASFVRSVPLTCHPPTLSGHASKFPLLCLLTVGGLGREKGGRKKRCGVDRKVESPSLFLLLSHIHASPSLPLTKVVEGEGGVFYSVSPFSIPSFLTRPSLRRPRPFSFSGLPSPVTVFPPRLAPTEPGIRCTYMHTDRERRRTERDSEARNRSETGGGGGGGFLLRLTFSFLPKTNDVFAKKKKKVSSPRRIKRPENQKETIFSAKEIMQRLWWRNESFSLYFFAWKKSRTTVLYNGSLRQLFSFLAEKGNSPCKVGGWKEARGGKTFWFGGRKEKPLRGVPDFDFSSPPSVLSFLPPPPPIIPISSYHHHHHRRRRRRP